MRGADDIAKMGFRLIVSPGPPGYYTNDSGSHSRRWPDWSAGRLMKAICLDR